MGPSGAEKLCILWVYVNKHESMLLDMKSDSKCFSSRKVKNSLTMMLSHIRKGGEKVTQYLIILRCGV